MNWLIYTLFALIFFGIINFLVKYIGEKDYEIIIIQALFPLFIFLLYLVLTGYEFQIKKQDVGFLVLYGLLYTVAVFSIIKAIKLSYNPAYVVALSNLSVIVTFLLSVVFLGDKINIKHLIGIVLSLLGASLIILG